MDDLISGNGGDRPNLCNFGHFSSDLKSEHNLKKWRNLQNDMIN